MQEIPTTQAFDVVPKDPLLGKAIGDRYLVEELIGSGGWGRVYRVLHSGLNKHMALKLLHSSHVFDREKLGRFKLEAEAVSQLDHPNICRVYDFAEGPEGQPCMIMELLTGTRLDELIKQREKLSLPETLNVGTQLCTALAAAHNKGIIHRDLKPANIMLGVDGDDNKLKVLDFGLAKIIDEEAQTTKSLTETGLVVGTPAYMSPEQCLGQPVDGRTDVYAIGCILYEAISGKKAFDGASLLETMNAHLNKTPKPYLAANASESERSLQAILMKCMEHDVDARYQKVDELLEDLTKLQQQQKVVVARRKKKASDKTKKLILASFAILCTAGTLYLCSQWFQPPQPVVVPGTTEDLTPHRPEMLDGKTLADWTKAIENDPDNPSNYIQRGRLHSMRDERDSAIEDFSTAIKLDPNDSWPYSLRAEKYVMTSKYEKALADASKCIQLSPHWSTGWATRARIYLLTERFPLAISDAKRALTIDGTDWAAASTLQSCYAEIGDYPDALATTDLLASISDEKSIDDRYWFHWKRGMVYLEARDFDKAIEDFKIANASHHKMAQSHGDLARAYAAVGDMKNAEDEIRKTLALDSFPARAYRLKGEMYRAGGQWAKAVQEYSTSTSLEPWFGPGFAQRAYAEMAMGELKSAEADLKRAAQNDPTSARAISTLAVVEDQLGKQADAERHIRQAFKLLPDFATNYFNRARIEMNHGKFADALKDLNAAVEINHRYADAYAARALLFEKLGDQDNTNKDREIAKMLHYFAPEVELKIGAPIQSIAGIPVNRPSLEYKTKPLDFSTVMPENKQFALGCSAIWTNLMATNGESSERQLEFWMISPKTNSATKEILANFDAIDPVTLKKALTDLGRPSDNKGVAALNHVRYIALCRLGFMAGWLTEDEAWKLILPVASSIQKQFDSWDDLANNYLMERKLEFSNPEDQGRAEDIVHNYLKETKRPPATIPFKKNLF